MRIIAGTARSRPIKTQPGQETRPTLDRVRENLFNMLQRVTTGARVLDLFSGSGALALEALSRGAKHAVMVDVSPAASNIQRENVAALGFKDNTTVLTMDWRKALQALSAKGQSFDLIFLDPPYEMTDLTHLTAALCQGGLLAKEGWLVVEHGAQASIEVTDAFTLVRQRRYGVAGISIFMANEA